MKCNKLVDVGRRSFLRGGVLSPAGAAASVMIQPAPANAQSMARVEYPGTKLANLTDLVINEPMDIAYPDADSPGILLKLGTAVNGGVGPDGDIMAYSVMCPHKGCQLQYNGTDKTLNCPGYYLRFGMVTRCAPLI